MQTLSKGAKPYLWLHWLVAGKVQTEVWNGNRLVLLCWLVGVDRPSRHHLHKGSNLCDETFYILKNGEVDRFRYTSQDMPAISQR